MAADRRLAGLLLGILLWFAATVGAQAGPSILQRGPLPVRGIPYLPPNVLPAYRGEYLAGESRIVVYFTREPLVLPGGWHPVPCGQDAPLRVAGEERLTFCYVEPGDAGYGLFVSFESESFPWCAWMEAFLQRLRYLLAFTPPTEVSFPAVLEY
jgi:hypothetical protein